MVHKFSFVIILLLAVIGGISLISGCHRGMEHCPFHRKSPGKKAEWVVKRLSKELKLNDSQKQKLNQIKDEILVKVHKVKGSHEQMVNTVLSSVVHRIQCGHERWHRII
jgi:hypothetical protein